MFSDVEYDRKKCREITANMETELTQVENILLTHSTMMFHPDIDDFKITEEAIRKLQGYCEDIE